MYKSVPERDHADFIDEAAALTRALLHRHLGDQVLVERLLRVLDATAQILSRHRVDRFGRCGTPECQSAVVLTLPWRRGPCTVHEAFGRHLKGRRTPLPRP
jgi:hypothetical protein